MDTRQRYGMPIADRCRFYFAALPNTARKTVADISNTTNPINAEVRMGIFNILEQKLSGSNAENYGYHRTGKNPHRATNMRYDFLFSNCPDRKR